MISLWHIELKNRLWLRERKIATFSSEVAVFCACHLRYMKIKEGDLSGMSRIFSFVIHVIACYTRFGVESYCGLTDSGRIICVKLGIFVFILHIDGTKCIVGCCLWYVHPVVLLWLQLRSWMFFVWWAIASMCLLWLTCISIVTSYAMCVKQFPHIQ